MQAWFARHGGRVLFSVGQLCELTAARERNEHFMALSRDATHVK
jgi:hypothetical protein